MRYSFATFLLGTDGNDVFGWTGQPGHDDPFRSALGHRTWATPKGAAILGGLRDLPT